MSFHLCFTRTFYDRQVKKCHQFFKNNFICLFVYDYAGSSLLHRLFSSCSGWWLLCSCSMQASHCNGFSCCGAWVLGCSGFSSCSSWILDLRPSSCGAHAQLLCGMWDLPGSGIKPVFPALPGGFFATEPSGKPSQFSFVDAKRVSDFYT